MLWNILEYFETFWMFLEHFLVHWNKLKYIGIFCNNLKFFEVKFIQFSGGDCALKFKQSFKQYFSLLKIYYSTSFDSLNQEFRKIKLPTYSYRK